MTRILAKRMLSIVTQFVSDNQIGFVPYTFIAKSAMLVKLLQAHLDQIDDGGILVFCDMEKAFDRCDWDYLNKAIDRLKTQIHRIPAQKLVQSVLPCTMKAPLLHVKRT